MSDPDRVMEERFAQMREHMKEAKAVFGPYELPAVPLYEDLPCYPVEQVLELSRLGQQAQRCRDEARRATLLEEFTTLRDSIQKKPDAPERIYLWPRGKVPTCTAYSSNSDYLFNHGPDFEPYLFEMLLPTDATPRGAIVVCAGGDHGSASIHEGYQVCLDMNALGYQCFLLNNRPLMNPWGKLEAGADCARAIRFVRKNAEKYRINSNNVAFAGFSNGGSTGEALIRYYSGRQTVAGHFPGYEPDELDDYYGAPDAFLCVYGPRYKGADFDYTDVVYPPTFFAVGRLDGAMDNLHWVYPSLLAQGIPVEVHTFAGVPHGQAGAKINHGGVSPYPNFDLWEPLADAFLQDVFHPTSTPAPL